MNLDEPYPKEVFTILIWCGDRAKFGAPETKYKRVRDRRVAHPFNRPALDVAAGVGGWPIFRAARKVGTLRSFLFLALKETVLNS